MTFAYSRRALTDLMKLGFVGEWKYLEKALFEIPEAKANRALVELAVMIRLVDDAEDISDCLRQTQDGRAYGEIAKIDGSVEPLYIRDLSNKVMHAKDFRWEFPTDALPAVVCISGKPERWVDARIDLKSLAAFCGTLMS